MSENRANWPKWIVEIWEECEGSSWCKPFDDFCATVAEAHDKHSAALAEKVADIVFNDPPDLNLGVEYWHNCESRRKEFTALVRRVIEEG